MKCSFIINTISTGAKTSGTVGVIISGLKMAKQAYDVVSGIKEGLDIVKDAMDNKKESENNKAETKKETYQKARNVEEDTIDSIEISEIEAEFDEEIMEEIKKAKAIIVIDKDGNEIIL